MSEVLELSITLSIRTLYSHNLTVEGNRYAWELKDIIVYRKSMKVVSMYSMLLQRVLKSAFCDRS